MLLLWLSLFSAVYFDASTKKRLHVASMTCWHLPHLPHWLPVSYVQYLTSWQAIRADMSMFFFFLSFSLSLLTPGASCPMMQDSQQRAGKLFRLPEAGMPSTLGLFSRSCAACLCVCACLLLDWLRVLLPGRACLEDSYDPTNAYPRGGGH